MIIPYTMLSGPALQGLIEEFVLREGTDYGFGASVGSESAAASQALHAKVEQVHRQLLSGEVLVVYDAETESCDIVTRGSAAFRAAAGKQRDPA